MFIDVEQGSPEWFDLRLKKPTGSNFGKIMAWHDAKTHKWGAEAIKYARQKATERVTGLMDTTERFYSKDMARGTLQEPIARRLYEKSELRTVTNGGLFDTSDWDSLPLVSDSPDGLVSNRGCIEIKCVIPNTQWERIEKGGYDTSYKWQIQAHMLLAGRAWCDYIQYCDQMPEDKRLYIHRVLADTKMTIALRKRLYEFEDFIQEKVRLIS